MDLLTQLITDPSGFYGAHQLLIDQIAINALLALSIGITLRCGLLSQANVGFMAIGAYTAVLLHNDRGIPLWLGAPAGALAAMAAAVAIGLPVLRLSGVFLAIATIGFGEVVVAAILNIPVTGEGEGLTNLDVDLSPLPAAVVLGVAAFLLWRMARGRVGGAWEAIRQDPVAAEAHGIDVVRYQLLAFVLGALVAGLAGALEAHQTFALDPNDYRFLRVVQVLVFAVVGGATTVAGPILGALLLTALPEVVRPAADYRDAIYGLVLLAVVILRPQGLLGRGSGRPLRERLATVVAWVGARAGRRPA